MNFSIKKFIPVLGIIFALSGLFITTASADKYSDIYDACQKNANDNAENTPTGSYTLKYVFSGNVTTTQESDYCSCQRDKAMVEDKYQIHAACSPNDTSTQFYCYQVPVENGQGQYIRKCFANSAVCTSTYSQENVSGTNNCDTAQTVDNSGIFNGTYVPPPIQTQKDYDFLAPLEDANGQTVTSPDLVKYIQGMYILFIALSAVIAVVMIVYGGILYMSTDAISGKTNGKTIIVRTLWGLLLIVGSYVILYTINPTLVTLNNNGKVTSTNPNNGTITNSTGQWCADISVVVPAKDSMHPSDSIIGNLVGNGPDYSTSIPDVPYTRDCSGGASQNNCTYQLNTKYLDNAGKLQQGDEYTASSCTHVTPSSDPGTWAYCFNVSAGGKIVTTYCEQENVPNTTSQANCNNKLDQYHQNKQNIPLGSNTWKVVPGDTIAILGNSQSQCVIDPTTHKYTITIAHSNGQPNTIDDTSGYAYTINPNAAKECGLNRDGIAQTAIKYSSQGCQLQN